MKKTQSIAIAIIVLAAAAGVGALAFTLHAPGAATLELREVRVEALIQT